MRDTWTFIAVIRGWICRQCGHFNPDIGDCEGCGT
jgi:hypothetical protein